VSQLIRREIPRGLPPHRLLAGLPLECGARLLEACGAEGWGTRPGGHGAGLCLLALAPEVEFRGGLDALHAAETWLEEWRSNDPLAALVVGSLSYELGRVYERLPAPSEPLPPAVSLAGFRAVYRYDAWLGRSEVVGSDPQAVARLVEHVRSAEKAPFPPSPRLGVPRSRTSDAAYCRGVSEVQDWIRAGDVYQVNLSRRLEQPAPPLRELRSLYTRLTDRLGAPFSAYLETPDGVVLSNSPERFLRVEGQRIETCPIKGTRPRGESAERDRVLAKELLSSPKDRAEHVMIVDLERNDLGRLCRTGSVSVHRLAALRSFATVHHLVSSVQGRLTSRPDWSALLAATFPGGSITGAPKLRAMQIIHELEPVARDIYTGAIGYFDAAGGLDLSIAIRTASTRLGSLALHLGGGIVADSDPAAELRETRDKGRAFSRSWGGAE
jgi:para-aminobenzoate synthetase component 1